MKANRGVLRCSTALASFLVMALQIVLASSLCYAEDAQGSNLQALYDAHQWFALRDAIAEDKKLKFFQGAVEASFNQEKPAARDLGAVIRDGPQSSHAREAHELLAALYFRTGKYHEALAQVDALLMGDPKAEDAKNLEPLLQALSRFPDQAVVKRKAARIPMHLEDGNMFVPLTVNGVSANYIVDNGFSASGVSVSEAARLGFTVSRIDTKVDSMSGAQVGIRIAVAKDLVLGKVHLTNVAFYVFPDGQPPFDQLPVGERGILGLPVLLALQTAGWNPSAKTFSCGFSGAKETLSSANLAFESSGTFTQVMFDHSPLEFSLDTGAQKTDLYPTFAKKFPQVVASGKAESHTLTGVGGSADFDAVMLPSVTFQVGGRDVFLRPAHVTLKQNNSTGDQFFGNLGMDLLNQAASVSIDFRAMRLVLK